MKEFIRQGEDILLNANFAEAYIPASLFREIDAEVPKAAISYMVGTEVHTMGIFNIRIMDSDTTPVEKYPLQTFIYPTAIVTYPSDVIQRRMKLLDTDEEEELYYVLQYMRGDIMMASRVVQSSDNCEAFINMVLQGKIPTTIAYDKLLEIWEKNFAINGIDSGVPSTSLQMVLSEMNRCRNIPQEQFRKIAGKGGADMHSYLPANMRSVASYTNVLNALSFENMGEMLTTSINITRSHKPQTRTPLEKAITI